MVKKSRQAVTTDDIDKKYDPEPYFELLDLFFSKDKQVLIQHHIDSYHQFIREIIPSIIQSSENIIYEKVEETRIMRLRLTFDEPRIRAPYIDNDEELMYPQDALNKNLSYSAKYTATITQWQDIIDIATGAVESKIIGVSESDIPIAKIPVMVGSDYCNTVLKPNPAKKQCIYDAGGYFILNGSEKVVLSIESLIYRKPLVVIKREPNFVSYEIKVQSRPVQQFVGNVQTFVIRMKKDNSLVLTIPYFKEISVFTLMRAMGLETDRDITEAVLNVDHDKTMLNLLTLSLSASNTPSLTREEAEEAMINAIKHTKNYTAVDPAVREQQRKRHLQKILTQYVLPHVTSGTDNPVFDLLYKAYYIAYMIHKLLKCYLRNQHENEQKSCDDRDSMINKRVDTSGVSLGTLFYQFFKKMLSDCTKFLKSKKADEKKSLNIIKNIKPNSIDQGLSRALSTGTFGSQSRKGFSQMLNRLNYIHSLSYMRRVITPVGDAAGNKLTGPREQHNTQWGSYDPAETPEGAKIGLIKNLAMMCSVTINMNEQIPKIKAYLREHIMTLESIPKAKLHSHVKVFLNGNWMGMARDVIKIHHDLRERRFRGEIEKTVSLVLNYSKKEFHVYTEGGRLVRPFLTVTDNKLNFKPEMLNDVKTWHEFISKYPHVIEYVDKEEEQNMMLAPFPHYIERAYQIMQRPAPTKAVDISMINRTNRYDGYVFPRYSHCEIHPSMILGLVSSNIIFINFNQGPRTIIQYSQARQAMGIYMSTYRERIDISFILYHPQLPIVSSRASRYTGSQIFPAGENSIVAVASYNGYNQEDSIMMNRSSIDRGFFRAQSLKKYGETAKKNPASSQTSKFMKPEISKVEGMKDANYSTLTENGYAKLETVVKDGDVIIGMVNPKPTNQDDQKPYKDSSTIYKSLIPGTVDKVITGTNNDGYHFVKMRIRSERIPIDGDKLSSRHSQKATIGFRAHASDMLFSESGLVPDFIMNPNAFPKRMTIGQLQETTLSRYCVIKGIYGDGTPFSSLDIDEVNRKIVEAGGAAWSRETMYNGMTGVRMNMQIFIGPTYYQRLRQMVGDKAHSRARGPIQILTRQPTEGRSREGGLRLGEMERDALCAHGAAQFLKERMVDNSDIYTIHVCDVCGLIAYRVPNKIVTKTRGAKPTQANNYRCQTCKTTNHITKVILPYACKLFFQELRAISILCRIRTANSITIRGQR